MLLLLGVISIGCSIFFYCQALRSGLGLKALGMCWFSVWPFSLANVLYAETDESE